MKDTYQTSKPISETKIEPAHGSSSEEDDSVEKEVEELLRWKEKKAYKNEFQKRGRRR